MDRTIPAPDIHTTSGKLADVEAIEALLRTGGLRVYRVRLHEAGAQRFLRLEVDPDELSRINGFGPARIEKYADAILAIVAEAVTEPE